MILRDYLVCIIASLWLCSCCLTSLRKPWDSKDTLKISRLPSNLSDDCDQSTFIPSLQQSITFYDRLPAETMLRFGPTQISVGDLTTALRDLKKQASKSWGPNLIDYIQTNFHFYRSTAPSVLFTGYFEATLQGARTPNDRYRFPLFRVPPDLVKVDLSQFPISQELATPPQLMGRLTKEQRVLPYYTRAQIDYEGVLTGRDLELLWVDNMVDLFFLHIQGSGVVELPDDSIQRVGFASRNGHPYRAIGRYLIDQGLMTRNQVSMQTIKEYLQSHPQQQREILSYNPSYVFFEPRTNEIDTGPLGSLQVPLTAQRSIATDSKLFPRGALAFIRTKRPRKDKRSETEQTSIWESFSCLVLNQDTGGAINGPGRVDLFTGRGPVAEEFAGALKHEGELYFLVPKATSRSN